MPRKARAREIVAPAALGIHLLACAICTIRGTVVVGGGLGHGGLRSPDDEQVVCEKMRVLFASVSRTRTPPAAAAQRVVRRTHPRPPDALRLVGGAPPGAAAARNRSESEGSRSRAQRLRTAAGPEVLRQAPQRAPPDARVLEGIAPPASAAGPRGWRGRSLGLGQFPAKGSAHPGRPGPKKGTKPAPARCSICFSTSHRRPACPDAMLSDIESEREPDDPAATASENLARSLLAACKVGNATQADELVAAGASVNAADKRDLLDSALHRAAYWGHAALVSRLVHHGADVALRNRLDYTALHWAAGACSDPLTRLAACSLLPPPTGSPLPLPRPPAALCARRTQPRYQHCHVLPTT
jgi:hypothetical protein